MFSGQNKKNLYIALTTALLFLFLVGGYLVRINSCSNIYEVQRHKYDASKKLADYSSVYEALQKHGNRCRAIKNNPALSVHYAYLEFASGFISGKSSEVAPQARKTLEWLGQSKKLEYTKDISSETTDIADMAGRSLPESVSNNYYKVINERVKNADQIE